MTAAQIARFLIEDVSQIGAFGQAAGPSHGGGGVAARGDKPAGPSKIDPKIKVLMNRIMLQAFESPSVQVYMVDAGVVDNGDGTNAIQIDFLRLPEEVLPQIERLFSVDSFAGYKWTRYVKNGQAHTGLELTVRPKDIPGKEYDYAY